MNFPCQVLHVGCMLLMLDVDQKRPDIINKTQNHTLVSRRRRADVRAQAVVPLCPTLKYSTIHLQYKKILNSMIHYDFQFRATVL